MGSVSFLVLFLVFLSSAAEEESKHPLSCLSFDCEKLGRLPFPFNESRPGCGFFEAVNCSDGTPRIQLERGGRYYRLKTSSQGGSDTIVIQDEGLQEDFKKNRCDRIDNLHLPRSPSVSFKPASALSELTLFKCRRNISISIPSYYTYNRCNDFVIHYNLTNHISDRPPSPPPPPHQECSMIQYPINTSIGLPNLVPLLTSDITLQVSVSPDCLRCRSSGRQCQDHEEENFRCARPGEDMGEHTGSPPDAHHTDMGEHTDDDDKTGKLAIGFGVGGGIITIFIICFIVNRDCYKRKYTSTFQSSNTSSDPSSTPGLDVTAAYFGIPIFQYTELEEATNYFDPDKEIGDGGFGTVYHGNLRDGREVAVKRLYRSNYKRVAQFMNEVQMLTRLRHPNLVSLYGCTSRHSRELLLVYEFIPNGTVADHLHGDRTDSGLLTWPIRLKIAVETADALCYLHASDVVHRDVKTNNILLDHSFCVKVADFGISRLFPLDVTHVSTAPQGTPGYVDPEYHQCYQLTEKSDVYSFGVVLIELISSLPAVDITRDRHEINLSNYAINKIEGRAFHELVDPRLGFDSDVEVNKMTTQVAELAFRCLQPDKEMRPSMDEVLEILKEIENDKHEFKKLDRAADSSTVGSSPYCDEVGLFRSVPLMPLPADTVTAGWTSMCTAPSTASL